MTTFYLLRHAHSQANSEGILAGRIPDIHLSTIGRKQAKALTGIGLKIDIVVSSPLERCMETVKAFATSVRKPVIESTAFLEMNYGDWSGAKLKSLARKRDWQKVRKEPSRFTFPNGESFSAAEQRVITELKRLNRKYPQKRILIVSHGDIIKMAINATLDLPLDRFQRIIVDPASLSAVEWNAKQKSLLHLNLPTSKYSQTQARLSARATIGGGSNV